MVMLLHMKISMMRMKMLPEMMGSNAIDEVGGNNTNSDDNKEYKDFGKTDNMHVDDPNDYGNNANKYDDGNKPDHEDDSEFDNNGAKQDADDKVDEEVDNSGEGNTCDTGNIAESNNKVNKYEGGNKNNTSRQRWRRQ